MKRVGRISRSFGQAWLTGVWSFLIVYFAFHAFQGDSSVATFKALERQEQSLLAQAGDIRAYRMLVEMRISKLGGDTLEPDMLEEQVRKRLGFTHPDEVVLFLE